MSNLFDTLVVSGIPSSSAFTKKLLEREIEKLESPPLYYNTFSSVPLPCDGCGYCKTDPKCKHRDLDEFFANFTKANNIIFAFPVYNNSVPAPLKALLDRFQQFYYARFVRGERPPIKGKRDVTIIMTMGAERDVTPLILEQLLPIFTICGCRLKTTITLTGTDYLDQKVPHDAVITHY